MENLGKIEEAVNKEMNFLVKPLLGNGSPISDPLDPQQGLNKEINSIVKELQT